MEEGSEPRLWTWEVMTMESLEMGHPVPISGHGTDKPTEEADKQTWPELRPGKVPAVFLHVLTFPGSGIRLQA